MTKAALTCIHCGEPCGVTGHVRHAQVDLLGDVANVLCPSVGSVRISECGRVRIGFGCRPGHTCLTASPLVQAFGRSLMTAPIKDRDWREKPPTPGQIGYLEALGYRGPRPVTRGQAHDLLDRIKRGELSAEDAEPARRRAIRVRGSDAG
jgi:hypothetical protein